MEEHATMPQGGVEVFIITEILVPKMGKSQRPEMTNL